MRRRTYAADTNVSVAQTRTEIDKLLRAWGADALAWRDDFTEGIAMLAFVWRRDGSAYHARFSIHLRTRQEIEAEARDRRNGKLSQAKLTRLSERNGRTEHRVMYLWLKAAFNAIEAGIVDAETIFLPFMVGRDGQTVAEVAVPRMGLLLTGSASKLLGAGES